MRSLAMYALLFALVLCGPPLLAGDRAASPLEDVVAVGRGRGGILLATLATPATELRWRFRKIAIAPPGHIVRRAVLSASGTKMLVVFSDETASVLDLTERIAEFSSTRPQIPQHHLPHQRFPLSSERTVCLLDDSGLPVQEACRDAADAVVAADGRVLYALADGSLIVEHPNGTEEQLQYHLPHGARFELLAGKQGDRRHFLILVTMPSEQQNSEANHSVTQIIDPGQPAEQLGHFADRTVAALRAQMDFAAAPATDQAASASGISDAALSLLASRLEEQDQDSDAGFAWSFYRIAPNPDLYAPVLEFAPGERDYPADADIWQEIAPMARGNSRVSYEAAYSSLGDRRWSRCTFYFRTLSFPGTWLIEYWFYYPFDEGNPHPHIHDSEHLFVEVDKLGGTVRNFFASDHDSFVPNNLYSTLVKNAAPVTLPLFATVELGKHAMSPDLNHDGRFSPGVDDNLHVESYSFWGLRDRGTKFRFFMEPYRSSMSLPHTPDGHFALADAASLFPDINVPSDHAVCHLAPLPEDPPCANCAAASAGAAIKHLVDHPDALVPENIYKTYVVPWREIRVGAGIYDWREGRGQFSVALAAISAT